MFLTALAKFGRSASLLRSTFPHYVISKNKINLDSKINPDKVLGLVKDRYKRYPMNTEDGLKIEFENEWVHLRKSNTEPIIRIYVESKSSVTANNLAEKIMKDIGELSKIK